MEADILDESGAMSIVWDCMIEGGQMEQSYIKTYKHIDAYTYKTLETNPMKTDKAKEFWVKKKELTIEFLNQLMFDLALNES